MNVHTVRRRLEVGTSARVLVAASVAWLLALAPASAQTPPADYDGTSANFFISANSMLRYGDSLLSKRYMTVGSEGMQVKGRGRCTTAVCPVSFNGIDLFARRSRLRLDAPGSAASGAPGSGYGILGGGGGGAAGGSYAGAGGKQCAGITRTLRPGDDNLEVRALQEILIKAGFREVTADGRFGRKTEAAIVQMQRRANITADGRVGPKTLQFLPC